MRCFKKDDKIVGVGDKFIYLIEVYDVFPDGLALNMERHVSIDRPLNITKKLLSTKKRKDQKEWQRRYITLEFAPEEYLRKNGYWEV